LSIPRISKSVAKPRQCWEVIFEPIAIHNSPDLKPEEIVTGFPK